MLRTYSDFLASVESSGLMAFSGKVFEGLPKLDQLTTPSQWHTGDPDTDPWQWKDRAAAEKRLAFGCILGGHKGFISMGFYPLFYAACRPSGTFEQRYYDGYVSKTAYDVYKLFQDGSVLDTSDIRRRMNVSKKEGASAVDTAMTRLQSEFYITVCGNRRKVSSDGMEYGWPANTYCRIEDWAGDQLTDTETTQGEARAQILKHCGALNNKIDLKKLEKLLFKTNG
jgi:hypothetical protein